MCVAIVVDVCCCRCAQQAIPHLSEMQRVWVYVMVVHARVHVREVQDPFAPAIAMDVITNET